MPLVPAFDPRKTNYTVNVPSVANFIAVTVTKSEDTSWGAPNVGNSYGTIEYTLQDGGKTTVLLNKTTPEPDSYEILVSYTQYNATAATVNVFVQKSNETKRYVINTIKQ